MKKISLIGSTGSIGRQVINVALRHPDEYEIVALVGGTNEELFESQVSLLKPKFHALASKDRERALNAADCEKADIVFNAASGFAGLQYSLRAVQAGKNLALANKETLVCGGELIVPLAKKHGSEILPVDSEHSAIWQCLNFDCDKPVRRLIITASGGAFANLPYQSLKNVTAAEALSHPTWKMGKKITIDSATLMNKGYEVIEAHYLYGTPYHDIETVIQPQSIIHSLVEFTDGSLLAQMSYPTMELPIQIALSYPKRLDLAVRPMDFKRAFSLDFKPIVRENYPCFDFALKCGQEGGVLPCAMNAADEEAVKAFLEGKIAFTDIYTVVERAVGIIKNERVQSFEQLSDIDRAARISARSILKTI